MKSDSGNILTLLLMLLSAAGFARETKQDTLRELLRKVDILTRELENEKLGEVSKRKYQSKYGLGPAASQVYHKKDPGVSLAGYGELVFQNYAAKKDDNSPGGKNNEIDYLRNILYLGYKFSDRFLFNAEIEFEHALAGEDGSGEVAMEFGYIDAMIVPEFTVRTGMVLIPVGIINEYHEPSTYYGALRPETERYIIPSTWRGVGFGFVGAINSGIGYRAYVTEGLNAAKFSSAGIRSGRQSGAEAIAEDFGISGKLEYTGVQGLNIGGSFYSGNSGQGLIDSSGKKLAVGSTIFSLHGIFARNGWELRALYAKSSISDVADLNNILGFRGNESIGESQFGYYVTAAYDILQLLKRGSTAMLQPFVQYEKLNTQDGVPGGFSSNPINERTNLTVGLMYKPIPNIGFKVDYINRDNETGTALDQFNAAVTYLF